MTNRLVYSEVAFRTAEVEDLHPWPVLTDVDKEFMSEERLIDLFFVKTYLLFQRGYTKAAPTINSKRAIRIRAYATYPKPDSPHRSVGCAVGVMISGKRNKGNIRVELRNFGEDEGLTAVNFDRRTRGVYPHIYNGEGEELIMDDELRRQTILDAHKVVDALRDITDDLGEGDFSSLFRSEGLAAPGTMVEQL